MRLTADEIHRTPRLCVKVRVEFVCIGIDRTDQNGQKRYVTEVNMDTFQLLGPRGQGGAPGAAPASSYNQQNSYSPAQNSAPAYDAPMDGDGDDLPF